MELDEHFYIWIYSFYTESKSTVINSMAMDDYYFSRVNTEFIESL